MGISNKKKKQDKVIFDFTKIEADVNASIDEFLKKKMIPYAKKEGQTLGRKHPAQPLKESSHLHPTEIQIQTMYISKHNDVDSKYNLSASIEEKKSRTLSLMRIYQNRESRREEERTRLIESNETKKNNELNKVHLNHQSEILQMEDQISKKKAEELELESELENINTELSETRESRPSKKKKFAHKGVMGGLVITEIGVNYSAFSYVMRENAIITFLAVLSVGIVLVALAHFAGMLVKRIHKSRTDYLFITSSMLGGLAVCSFVGVIRAASLESGTQGMSASEVAGINFAFFLLGMVISYMVSFRNPELIKQFKNLEENLEIIRKDLSKIYKKISELVDKTSDQLNEVEEKYLIDVDSELDELFAGLRLNIIKLAKEYNTILSIAKAIYKKLNSYYKESISTFRSNNVRSRTDGGVPQYFSDPIENLETELSRYSELSINFNANTSNNQSLNF